MARQMTETARVRAAIRQLEIAQPYIDAVASLVPDFDEDVERIREELADLRQELIRLKT
jgi:hypothetical protein